MLIRKIIIGILSFYFYDPKANYRQKSFNTFDSEIVRTLENKKKSERGQERRKEKTYENRKWKKKKNFREKTFAIKGVQSKDVRFTNQKMIRRMYRNC